jgi:hypothetical protein
METIYSIAGQVKPLQNPLKHTLTLIYRTSIYAILNIHTGRFNFTVPSAKMDLKLRITYSLLEMITKNFPNVAGNISLRDFILNHFAKKQVMSIKALDVGYQT